MKKNILCLLFLIFSSLSIAQITKQDCNRLKHSKLHFIDSQEQDSYVLIENNSHTEYFDANGHYLKSELIWVSDCEYVAKIIEMNIPGAPFKIGDKLRVRIVKIENNIVDMICIFENQTLTAQYEILEYL